MERSIKIIDETVDEAINLGLRDEKLEKIISKLNKYPLEAIEVTLHNFCKLNNQSFVKLIRCKVDNSIEQLKIAKEAKVKKLVISIIYEEGKLFLEELNKSLEFAKTFAIEIHVSIENAAKYTLENLRPCLELLMKFKLNTVIYNDKEGILEPFITFKKLKELKKLDLFCFEFRGNNKLGLSSANSLAAIRAGVKNIYTSVCGVGINKGASMEEVLMAAKYFMNEGNINIYSSISQDCKERVKNKVKFEATLIKGS
jgi:homocitrate synthase NifV